MMSAASQPPVEDVIAHRGSMLLLDRIVHADAESCVAEYQPRADAWYADAAGHMPAWIGIELMAQTIAAQVGVAKRGLGVPPKQGMLLGTRSYKTNCPIFTADQGLRIEARLSFRDEGGLAAYVCQISPAAAPTQVLASAILKVFEPDDFQEFLKGKTP